MSARRPLALAACLAALALAPAGAPAASLLLGPPDLSASDPFATCGIECAAKVFVPTAVPGATLSAPADGVITSWSVKGAPPKALRLRVLRPLGDGGYRGVETSGAAHESSGTGFTTAMVAIGVGEQIGVELRTSFPSAGPNTLLGDSSAPGAAWVGFQSGIADGQVATPSASGTGAVPLVNATVELRQPVIELLGDSAGPASGGGEVLIAGRHLAIAQEVRFGGLAAQITAADNNHIRAIAPAHGPGAVDVTVTTAGGTSQATVASRFAYRADDRSGAPKRALRLRALRVSPRSFLAAEGATASFRSSDAARVRFALQRRVRERWRGIGSFARNAKAGRNTFRLGSRLADRRLVPGRYRLVAQARSADGERSRLAGRPFRILKPGGQKR